MATPAPTAGIWRFGVFEVDAQREELRRTGVPIKLREQSLRILLLLLENAGELVTREDLRKALWPGDTYVDFDHSLNAAVMKLREALGDAAEKPLYIETVPKRGYRFIAPFVSSAEVHERSINDSPLPSIAVLPFVNLSADKENEYFSDGLADDIIDALTRLRGLRVIARTSSFAFRGKDVDAREIGDRLKVATILEGSVRKDGNRIRVSAQLVKAADQSHLWSERYDREMNDIFAIQDDISRAIVEKLRVELLGNRPLVKQHTKNLEAYNLFLRGRYCILRMTPESLAEGKRYLEQALSLDPNYPMPYTALAEYYSASALWGLMQGKEAMPKLKGAALAALRLDDSLAEARAQLGVALGVGDFSWVAAEQEFQKALELNPASPTVHLYYGLHCLRPMGRLDEDLQQARTAVELDPLSARWNWNLGYVYGLSGQYDLAIAHHRLAIDLSPGIHLPYSFLAVTYGHMRRFKEAIAEAETACRLSGRNARVLGILAWLYGENGQMGEARALLNELTNRSHSNWVPPFAMMAASICTGDLNQQIEWLEKGVEDRDLQVISIITVDPVLVHIASHPRYRALLRSMNLNPDCGRCSGVPFRSTTVR